MELYVTLLLVLGLTTVVNSQPLIDVIKTLANSHDFEGISGGGDLRDEEYASCIQFQQGAMHSETGSAPESVFGPFYRFTVEKNVVRLPCSPCFHSSRPFPTWFKLTFDGQRIQIGVHTDAAAENGTGAAPGKYQIENDDSLVISSVNSVSDFATFYCEMNGFVGNIWTLEPEAYAHLTFVASKKWETDTDSRVDQFPGAVVSIAWEPWEPCNKCDFVGKQYRIGYCKVQEQNPNLETGLETERMQGPQIPTPTDKRTYEALALYPSGVSCTLFNLLHGISAVGAQNLALERSLIRGPFVMLDFCRVPCANFDFDPRTRFESLDPTLRAFYKQDLRKRIEEQELLQELNEHETLHHMRVRGISLASFIPTRMPTRFEWFLLAALAALQIYIIVHVRRNRSKAN